MREPIEEICLDARTTQNTGQLHCTMFRCNVHKIILHCPSHSVGILVCITVWKNIEVKLGESKIDGWVRLPWSAFYNEIGFDIGAVVIYGSGFRCKTHSTVLILSRCRSSGLTKYLEYALDTIFACYPCSMRSYTSAYFYYYTLSNRLVPGHLSMEESSGER